MSNVFVEFSLTLLLALSASLLTYVAGLRILKANSSHSIVPARALSPRVADGAFLALTAAYTLVFAVLSTLRHLSFNTGGYDMGIFDQAIWNSLRGRLLENSILPDAPTLFSQRFSPILLAFVPLYALWSDPLILLIVQTLALSVSAFPLYWFARERVGRVLALVVAVAYFLSPALQYVNLFQFHEIAFTVTWLAFATFFLWRRSDRAFLVCLGLALLTKEEIAFVTIGFGVFICLIQRRWWFGLALALFGLLWGALLLQYVIPSFRPSEFGTGYYYFGSALVSAGRGRYDYLGHSLLEIVSTVLTRPDIVLQHLLIPPKFEFVLHLLVPVAFVPLIGAEVGILMLPTLGYSLLSDYAFQYSIRSKYTAPLLPFLYFALAIGLQRILRWKNSGRELEVPYRARQWALAVLILAASGVSYYLHAPGPLARHFEQEPYVLNEHTAIGYAVMRAIPDDAAVVAQTELAAHLSERKYIYEFPSIPDYRQADYLFADTTRLWYGFHRGSWDRWLATGYFEIVAEQDGYFLARRRAPTHSLRIQYGNQVTLLGYTLVTTDTLHGGQELQPIVEWQANRTPDTRYRIVVRLVDRQGHLWAEQDREPQDGNLPTTRWEVGKPVGDQYTLRLPPTMPAGDYQITIAVREAGNYLEAYDERGNQLGTEATLATVRIEKNKSSYTASELAKEQPLVAHFVDMQEIRLLGYYPPRETISSGEVLPIGLYWKARAKPRGDYLVAVQLRDADGRTVFEHASRPANGTYPTTLWDAGEVLLDWHDFDVPRDIAAGNYQIVVLLRDAEHRRGGVPPPLLGEATISSISITR